MPGHTDSEIEQAARHVEHLADVLNPATTRAEGTNEIDELISPAARSFLGPSAGL